MARPQRYKAIAKENQRIYKNVSRRIERVAKKYGENAFIVREWKKANVSPTTRGLSLQQLTEQSAQLHRFETLKSSTVKGYKNYLKWSENVVNLAFADIDESELYKLYNKFVEENGLIAKYKYEAFDVITEMLIDGESEETIRERVMELQYDSDYGYDDRYDKDSAMFLMGK